MAILTKYLIIPQNENDPDGYISEDLKVANLSENNLEKFLKDSWNRGCPPPIVLPLSMVKEAMDKYAKEPLTLEQLESEE